MKMKILILIGLLSLYLNCFSNVVQRPIINAVGEATSANEAEIRANNEFRRLLLEYMSGVFQDNLGEYFEHWRASGQGFNRNLIETMIRMADKQASVAPGRHTYRIQLFLPDFNHIIQAERDRIIYRAEEYYENFREYGDLEDLLFCIDLLLLFNDETSKERLDILTDLLRNFNVDFQNRHLIHQVDNLTINFTTPVAMNSFITFRHRQSTVEINVNHINTFSLNVGFNSTGTPRDIEDLPYQFDIMIGSDNQIHTITYEYDLSRTFRLNRFIHEPFLNRILTNYFTAHRGEILLNFIPESRFIVQSENFYFGINRINESLIQKGWLRGNLDNYSHNVELNKVVVEERRLNIGSFYVRGYLELNIFDNQRNLLQRTQSREFEAVDNRSFEGAHSRLDRQLLREVQGLL